MSIVTNSAKRVRVSGSLYPKDFKESQREYEGVVMSFPGLGVNLDGEYTRIRYSLDDITLHDGTNIEGIADEETLMQHLENNDVYTFEADASYLDDGIYMLTNIVIPHKVQNMD
jgi:hypothetical protein